VNIKIMTQAADQENKSAKTRFTDCTNIGRFLPLCRYFRN